MPTGQEMGGNTEKRIGGGNLQAQDSWLAAAAAESSRNFILRPG